MQGHVCSGSTSQMTYSYVKLHLRRNTLRCFWIGFAASFLKKNAKKAFPPGPESPRDLNSFQFCGCLGGDWLLKQTPPALRAALPNIHTQHRVATPLVRVR